MASRTVQAGAAYAAALAMLLLTGLGLLASAVPAAPAAVPAIAHPETLWPDGVELLAPGSLLMPVVGANASSLRDMFNDVRGHQRHEAIDIMAPRGTPVVAVADGPVAKLFTSKPGGLTVYQFDMSGRLAYYYAHLDSYARGLKQGLLLRRGDPIGRVGSTGNAPPDAPHLHFAVFVLGPERQWWVGTAVNPYPLLAVPRPQR